MIYGNATAITSPEKIRGVAMIGGHELELMYIKYVPKS
jgi:hypothetical protein